ncbi:deoxyribonuclease ii [Anopheles darlingi]|uniref:Deoxyribonuclease ii n=1 Tax=Anopheles darlingi TaxID=43151 RepID=W5J581_ANODA|nr:deoxyribonuclease ii [Anopheles darlingi]
MIFCDRFSLLFVLLIVLFASASSKKDDELGCRVENGELVDWYYAYKLPKDPSEHDSASNGLRYTYVSSKDESAASIQWLVPQYDINHPESVAGRTIAPVLASNSTLLTILYNDEPTNGPTDMERGHTKGVFSTDGKTGFWLIHSVPKFPPEIGTEYSYPHTGQLYGQSFLCITLNASQMETVAGQFIHNELNVYSTSIPSRLGDRFPTLAKVARMTPFDRSPPFYSQKTIQSRAGVEFVTFAKSREFGKELYADWIAPALDVGLLVESWQHGAGNLPSECVEDGGRHSVLNVREVQVGGKASKDRFTTMKDHSKWAVDLTVAGRWICVGDINRQEHQKQRGGGSVCRISKPIASLYRGMVLDVQPCPKPDRIEVKPTKRVVKESLTE